MQCCNIKKKAAISGVKNGYLHFIRAHIFVALPQNVVYFSFTSATPTWRTAAGGIVLCLFLSVGLDGISLREIFSL